MSLKMLVFFFASLFILNEIQSVQSELLPVSPFRYGKWGIGPCPKVTPMDNFDITKLYGGPWYTLAHYFNIYMLDRHCTETQFSDGNPGKDSCRVLVNRTSIEYDDGHIKPQQYYLMLPNETEQSTWISVFHDMPIKSYILDTDYNNYLLTHECIQFPRDNPILYEQFNYIRSRTAVWPGGMKDIQKSLEVYESFRIDTGPFVWHDQESC